MNYEYPYYTSSGTLVGKGGVCWACATQSLFKAFTGYYPSIQQLVQHLHGTPNTGVGASLSQALSTINAFGASDTKYNNLRSQLSAPYIGSVFPLSSIKYLIDNGSPLYSSWKVALANGTQSGHAMLIIGYNADTIILLDSNRSSRTSFVHGQNYNEYGTGYVVTWYGCFY